MIEFCMTALTALFLAGSWSRFRYGFFDLMCYGAALAGALLTPHLMERVFPDLMSLGAIGAEAGGALIGCALYDSMSYASR